MSRELEEANDALLAAGIAASLADTSAEEPEPETQAEDVLPDLHSLNLGVCVAKAGGARGRAAATRRPVQAPAEVPPVPPVEPVVVEEERFYAVWGPIGVVSVGIHCGAGTSAYDYLLEQVGGNFRLLAWRRAPTLEAARELYAERTASRRRDFVLPAAVYRHY